MLEEDFKLLSEEYTSSGDLLDEDIDVEFDETIDEANLVSFDNQIWPKYNHAVVLAGGAGSGKSFTRKKLIPIEAKVLDVDKLKELYIEMQKKGKNKEDTHKYNLRNPEDVGLLHQKVKEKGLKAKQEDAFFSQAVEGRMPNVIFDITGDEPKKLVDIGRKLKNLGYHVTLVWVVANREVAFIQNQGRDRVVPEEIFHATHNGVKKAVTEVLKSFDAKYYDAAWVLFSGLDSVKGLSSTAKSEIEAMGAIKLKKSGAAFALEKDIEEKIALVLGPDEVDPKNPKTYITYKEFDKIENSQVRAKNRDFSMQIQREM